MPFLKHGGLFVRTDNLLPFGTKALLKISLPSNELFEIDAEVVWMTPKGAQNNKPAGIGLHFTGEQSRVLCNKIDTFIAAMLKSGQMTHTM